MTQTLDDIYARAAPRLKVKFSQPDGTHGWIYLSLGFQSPDGTWRRDTAGISYCYCPLKSLKEWMEALVRGCHADPSNRFRTLAGQPFRRRSEATGYWLPGKTKAQRCI